jgi:hypothetical protein
MSKKRAERNPAIERTLLQRQLVVGDPEVVSNNAGNLRKRVRPHGEDCGKTAKAGKRRRRQRKRQKQRVQPMLEYFLHSPGVPSLRLGVGRTKYTINHQGNSPKISPE